MIKAYILIQTSDGKSFRYVRDVVNDSYGVGEITYKYEGNGYQAFGLTAYSQNYVTGLNYDTYYYFKVNVDGGGATEYYIYFKKPTTPNFRRTDNPDIMFFDLLDQLDQLSSDFQVRYIDDDIRIISNGSGASTSIALTAGTSGTDLFTALNTTPSAAVASDNYDNQTGAGKVQGDYSSLVTSWSGATGLLSFPESGGATPILRRKNLWNGVDDHTQVITQILNTQIASISVVEEQEENIKTKY